MNRMWEPVRNVLARPTLEEYPRAPGDAWVWVQERPEKRNGWPDQQ